MVKKTCLVSTVGLRLTYRIRVTCLELNARSAVGVGVIPGEFGAHRPFR